MTAYNPFFYETNMHFPIVICLDVSSSMAGPAVGASKRWELQSRALEDLLRQLARVSRTRAAAEVAFIAFSSKVICETEFMPLTKMDFTHCSCNGSSPEAKQISVPVKEDWDTHLVHLNIPIFKPVSSTDCAYLSPALNLAVEKLEQYRKHRRQRNEAYYPPFLLLFSGCEKQLLLENSPSYTDQKNADIAMLKSKCDDSLMASEMIVPFIVGIGNAVRKTCLKEYADGFPEGYLQVPEVTAYNQEAQQIFSRIFLSVASSSFSSNRAKATKECLKDAISNALGDHVSEAVIRRTSPPLPPPTEVMNMKQWKLACYSRRGRSHAKKNKDSQDSLKYHTWLAPGSSDVYDFAAVIADGVGSLPNSGFAAKEATGFALDWLQDKSKALMDANTPEHLLRELLPYVRSKLLRTARMRGISESSMDCNLAFVCVLRSASRILCGVLGDCAVCILGGEDTVLTDPTSTGSGTHTVLESQSENYLQCCVINNPIQKNVQGFLLTTDGLEGAAYIKNYRHPRKFASTLFNAALKCGSEAADENAAAGVQQQHDIFISDPSRELAQLVNSLPANYSDDISVAVISRAESPYVLPDDPQWLCTCGCHTSIFASRCSNCGIGFIDLYKNVTIETDVYDFFRELNKTPDRERKLIGLPPAPESEPPQNPKPVHTPGRTGHPRSQEPGSAPRTGSSIIGDGRLRVKKGPDNGPDTVPTGSSTQPNATESPKNAPDEQTGDAPKHPKLFKKVLGLIREHLSVILLFLFLIQLTVSVLCFIAVSQSQRKYDQLLERQMAVEEMLGIEYYPTEAPLEEEGELWCVTDSVLYVRDDLYGEKLFQLKRGEQVTVVGDPKTDAQGTQWVYIKHEEHGYGWCQLRSLELLQD